MKTLTVSQAQKIDRAAIEDGGVPSIALMENAGRAVADAVLAYLKKKRKKNPRVVVVCGAGNNAGDGFVAARHLWRAGIKPDVIFLGRPEKLKTDASVNYQILAKAGLPVHHGDKITGPLLRRVKSADVIVDAIFGVGLNRPVGEPFLSVIRILNDTGKDIVAVDIPSGLDGSTGKTYGVCVRAALTVTFVGAKKGFFKTAGPRHTGRIVVADIGIPPPFLRHLRCNNASSLGALKAGRI